MAHLGIWFLEIPGLKSFSQWNFVSYFRCLFCFLPPRTEQRIHLTCLCKLFWLSLFFPHRLEVPQIPWTPWKLLLPTKKQKPSTFWRMGDPIRYSLKRLMNTSWRMSWKGMLREGTRPFQGTSQDREADLGDSNLSSYLHRRPRRENDKFNSCLVIAWVQDQPKQLSKTPVSKFCFESFLKRVKDI